MVEARENTSSFEEGSTIWGTWVTDPNNLYHAVECNRSSSSSEGPFEVSHCELVSMRGMRPMFIKRTHHRVQLHRIHLLILVPLTSTGEPLMTLMRRLSFGESVGS